MNFFKKEFLLGVSVFALSLVAGSVVYYFGYTKPHYEQIKIMLQKQHYLDQKRAEENKLDERLSVDSELKDSSGASPDAKKTKKEEIREAVPPKIISQLKMFDDFLEYSLVGAQVDCNAVAVYNSVIKIEGSDSESFKQAFPESRQSYEDKCRKDYLDVVMHQKDLIAEPELQPLRMLLTSYSDVVKVFGPYALDGGSEDSHIDSSEKNMDNLRTLSREEIIRLKKLYGLK